MRKIFLILISFLYIISATSANAEKWMVYYSDKLPPSAFEKYDLLVFDSEYHPYLPPLNQTNKTILGYISLGEVEGHRFFYKRIRQKGILMQENPFWKGSYYVDVRDQRWGKFIIEEVIPYILKKGFDGLFFDTLDNQIELERANPEKYAGMVEASINLIKAIRKHFPDIKIMLNRAYQIAPEVANDIDMILGESVFADYDFENKTYNLVEEDLYRKQVDMLQAVRGINESLKIYTLDYWNPDDKEGIQKIYNEQRANGFIPLVSTIDLHQIIEGEF
jgi:uncharacterized protein (TIGR01370 family)